MRERVNNNHVRHNENRKEQAMALSLPFPRPEPLPFPRELYIESTTRCNEFCDQCPRTHLGREADRDITLTEVQGIVEQFPVLVKNLTQFQELKRCLGSNLPRVSLWFTAMRENFLELPRLVELAAAAG